MSPRHLDLARAVTQAALLAGREHGDHLIQAALQGAKHLPSSLLLAAVSGGCHVQRAGPAGGEQPLVAHSGLRYTQDGLFLSLQSTHLRSGLKVRTSLFGGSLFSAVFFLLSLEALPPPAAHTQEHTV